MGYVVMPCKSSLLCPIPARLSFTHCRTRRSGNDLIAELQAAGWDLSQSPSQLAPLAAVYNLYVRAMAANNMLDFDDLLHHCLALVQNNQEVGGGFGMLRLMHC